MIDYQPLYQFLADAGQDDWARQLPLQLDEAFNNARHGNLADWKQAVTELPVLPVTGRVLDSEFKIEFDGAIVSEQRSLLVERLQALMPWRKGPYQIADLHLDTEWRSDWKWTRIQDHITPLTRRTVLDVGCGNGYHCWRMLGAGAERVIGIDPYLLNVMQFQAIYHLYGQPAPVFVLPFGIENIPKDTALFDTVFSMGVLYHRKSPIEHLQELKGCLRPGGELVLETLVIDGGPGEVLFPPGRYANMRNVWFLPSCQTLESWLKRCGFRNIRIVDVTKTSFEEQRKTEWMPFHSLEHFLDSENSNLTSEGLPAPIRAVAIATID